LYHLNEDIAEHTEARERDKQGRIAGDVLDAVGHVRISPDDGSEAAVLEVTELVSSALGGLAESDRRSAVQAILKRIESKLCSGSVPHFLTELFDQFVQSERGSRLRIDSDILLALDLAICLREADPAWAKTRAQDAFEYWQSQLEQEPATEDVLSRAAGMLLDVFTTASRGFRNHRELQLWEMTQALVRWGLQGDAPAETMTQLQTAIERVEDIYLRYLLLAPVMCGWLQVQDFGRVHRLLVITQPRSTWPSLDKLERGGKE
jgi:hypothetical protein